MENGTEGKKLKAGRPEKDGESVGSLGSFVFYLYFSKLMIETVISCTTILFTSRKKNSANLTITQCLLSFGIFTLCLLKGLS